MGQEVANCAFQVGDRVVGSAEENRGSAVKSSEPNFDLDEP